MGGRAGSPAGVLRRPTCERRSNFSDQLAIELGHDDYRVGETWEVRAPKGSLYYYFPNGKVSIGVAAIEFASEKVVATLQELARRSGSPSRLITQYCELLAEWMTQSGFRDGCPITTTILELAPDQEEICLAGEAAFGAWATVIEQALLRSDVEASRAHRLSRFALAAISGALVQMRVQRSQQPLLDAATELELLLSV